MAEPIVSLRGITKRFGDFVANEAVSLDLYPGEIHALLGENGAGKTTLMNVLTGLLRPDGGEIRFRGRPVRIDSPEVAYRLGIGMVHQHFKLIPPFTVAENVVLGAEPRRGLLFDRRAAREAVRALTEAYGLAVNPDARVGALSVGMQQRVEILKILYRGADVLIFDEPTAVLTPQEVREFLAILKRLAGQGKAIVFITHKLKEVLAVADRVTILRHGRVVDTLPAAGADEGLLAEKMIGRRVRLAPEKAPARPGPVVLELRAVRERRTGQDALAGVDLALRAGEIYGLAGVDGNGQRPLVEVLFGRRSAEGDVRLFGEPILGLPTKALLERGMALIPEDRHREGLVLAMSVAENAILTRYDRPPFVRRGILRPAAIRRAAAEIVERFDVRTPSLAVPVAALSGGNQQKLIIGREVARRPAVVVSFQPTRGLDIGAQAHVYRTLVALRDAGAAVLLISFELDEILALADRIGVLSGGRIVAELAPEAADEETIGLYMTGRGDVRHGDAGRGDSGGDAVRRGGAGRGEVGSGDDAGQEVAGHGGADRTDEEKAGDGR
ncbi:ABC transporter ATP-binding protein [Hydrogenibacillus schlegelii]|uniref:ABC transporter ATP-binding protein n=1 Tax=Hydrogenibacillus schlegelii TaxID=1484 RepID=UPI0009EC5AF5|nr:ABC transporter ATP-binding protein [Hydrogenibacillus schlegelii]